MFCGKYKKLLPNGADAEYVLDCKNGKLTFSAPTELSNPTFKDRLIEFKKFLCRPWGPYYHPFITSNISLEYVADVDFSEKSEYIIKGNENL
jgi:hypothetical protein